MSMMDLRHGETPRPMSRAALRALSGHGDPGKFGRMFPDLDPLAVPVEALRDLAAAMKDSDPDGEKGDSPIPAGFTYLGQFVDHDITLDLTPLDVARNDPLSTRNFRSPQLDLDSVYGAGPAVSPYLYDRSRTGKPTGKLLIGHAEESARIFSPGTIPGGDFDLPRSRFGRAIIGDERNDENLLVAQTHLAFLKFHNAIVDRLPQAKRGSAFEAYQEARRIATWHYQWIVLFDFVERLTERGIVRKTKHQGRKFYRFRTTPYIPVEFSAAAYRLGHSMVRERYNHNAIFNGAVNPQVDGTLALLFHFTGKSGAIVGDHAPTDPNNVPQDMRDAFPGGPIVRTLPSNWAIDWRRFFDFETPPEPNFVLNKTRRLDPMIVPALHTLPGEAGDDAVLPLRNLRRGVQLELPSAQAILREIRNQQPIDELSEADLTSGPDGAAIAQGNMAKATPLWYYILKEAEVMKRGACLGPLGSLIIAETFLGIVHGDHESFLWLKSDWKPELESAEAGEFTMVDMLNTAGDLDPVGKALKEPAEQPAPAPA